MLEKLILHHAIVKNMENVCYYFKYEILCRGKLHLDLVLFYQICYKHGNFCKQIFYFNSHEKIIYIIYFFLCLSCFCFRSNSEAQYLHYSTLQRFNFSQYCLWWQLCCCWSTCPHRECKFLHLKLPIHL